MQDNNELIGLLEQAASSITMLGPEDLSEIESLQTILNQIFRGFHTIKGMAGFLNLTEIGSLAHSAENLLDLARKGELELARI